MRYLFAAMLVIWPVASSALEIVPEREPDCTEDGTAWFGDEIATGVLLATEERGVAPDFYDWLILCDAGQGVRAMETDAMYDLPQTLSFFDLAGQLVLSKQSYSLNDVAKLGREVGYETRVMAITPNTCICNLGRDE